MIGKKERVERGKLSNIWEETRRSTYKCLRPGCTRPAIKSHWLQLNGILNHVVATDGHLVQWTPAGAFVDPGFTRKSAKKSEMMRFAGFCEQCDKEVFSPLENQKPVYTDFQTQLLFSYRGLLNELRKLQFLYRVDNAVISNKVGLTHLTALRHYSFRNENLLKIKNMDYYKAAFDEEIHGNTEKSRFATFHASLPKIDIVATMTLGGGEFDIRTYEGIKKLSYESEGRLPELSLFTVLLIPTETSLELIICWLKDLQPERLPELSELQKMSSPQLLKMLSDFLLGGGENWAMSDNFFAKLQDACVVEEAVKVQEDRFFAMRSEYIYGVRQPISDRFNLFENII